MLLIYCTLIMTMWEVTLIGTNCVFWQNDVLFFHLDIPITESFFDARKSYERKIINLFEIIGQ